MRNLPPNLPDLPPGYAVLGYGEDFEVRRRFQGRVYYPPDHPQYNEERHRPWTAIGETWGGDNNAIFAAPIGADVCDWNRFQVEQFNPGAVFIWQVGMRERPNTPEQTTPAEAHPVLNEDLIARVLRENADRIATDLTVRQFLTPQQADPDPVRFTIRENNRVWDGMAEGMEEEARRIPAIPRVPTGWQQVVPPDPRRRTALGEVPLPDGYVLLGAGGEFEEFGRFRAITRPVHENARAWADETIVSGQARRLHYAVREDSLMARIQQMPIDHPARQHAITGIVMEANRFNTVPIPVNDGEPPLVDAPIATPQPTDMALPTLRPAPMPLNDPTWVIVGPGRSFTVPAGQHTYRFCFLGVAPNAWTERRGDRLTQSDILYAVPVDSPIYLANVANINHFNPERTPIPIPAPAPPPAAGRGRRAFRGLPNNLLLPPDGYVIIGWSDEIRRPGPRGQMVSGLYSVVTEDEDDDGDEIENASSWNATVDLQFGAPDEIFAVLADSPLAATHADAATHYGVLMQARERQQAITPAAIPLTPPLDETNMAAPPPPAPPAPPVAVASTQAAPAASGVFAAVATPRRWNITIHGAPISTPEELLAVITPLAMGSGTRVTQAADILWRAQDAVSAEDAIEELIDSEPVIMGIVDYIPAPQPTAVALIAEAPEDTEDPNRTLRIPAIPGARVADQIVRATAGVLLSGGMSDHFLFTETGIAINTENPPELEDGYEMIRRTLTIRETGDKLENFSSWTLGALLDELERFYGERFDMSAAIAQADRAYNTAITTLNVYRAYGANRRAGLSFTHHKEVHYANLAPEDPELAAEQKAWILDESERRGLVVSQQRKLVSYVRTYGEVGRQALIGDMPEDAHGLMERLETRSVNRNFMFMLQGSWYEYRGPFEHIPNGANPILNADTREVYAIDGQAARARTWTPVGIQVPNPRGHAALREQARETARETGEPVQHARGGGNTTPRTAATVEPTDEEAQAAAEEADQEIARAQVMRETGMPPNARAMDGPRFVAEDFGTTTQTERRERPLDPPPGLVRELTPRPTI